MMSETSPDVLAIVGDAERAGYGEALLKRLAQDVIFRRIAGFHEASHYDTRPLAHPARRNGFDRHFRRRGWKLRGRVEKAGQYVTDLADHVAALLDHA
jgi:hypothetical protein